MISEIKGWTYTKTQQTSVHTQAIQTAVFEDIAQRANLTNFDLTGYHGKFTERQ